MVSVNLHVLEDCLLQSTGGTLHTAHCTKQNAANFYKSRKNTFFVVLQIQNTSVNKLDMVLQNLNFLTIHNGELFGQSKKFHIDSFSKYP